jgi:hypothetical protein
MSLVGFDHVFTTAQPVPFAPDLTLRVISSTTLMLLKIVAYMDDPQRRAKDLEDIRGLLAEYETDSDRVFSEIVIDADLEDYGLAHHSSRDVRRIPGTGNRCLISTIILSEFRTKRLKLRRHAGIRTSMEHLRDAATESMRQAQDVFCVISCDAIILL